MSLLRLSVNGLNSQPGLWLRLLLLAIVLPPSVASADENSTAAPGTAAAASPATAPASAPPDEPQSLSAEALAAQAAKSLVVIRSTDRTGGELGLGTGFVISSDGLIATAWHVIGDGREIRVELADGRSLPVTAVHASSSQMDLAIVRVSQLDLPPLTLSLEGRTPQGREIVALGHPEGFRNAIVSGVISGYQ